MRLRATEASCMAMTDWWIWSVSPSSTRRVRSPAWASFASTVETRPSSIWPKPPPAGWTPGVPTGPARFFGARTSMRPAAPRPGRELTEPMGDMGGAKDVGRGSVGGLLADLEGLHREAAGALHRGEVGLVG